MGPGFESPPGHHVGAKTALLRRSFIPAEQKNVICPLPCTSVPTALGSQWADRPVEGFFPLSGRLPFSDKQPYLFRTIGLFFGRGRAIFGKAPLYQGLAPPLFLIDAIYKIQVEQNWSATKCVVDVIRPSGVTRTFLVPFTKTCSTWEWNQVLQCAIDVYAL